MKYPVKVKKTWTNAKNPEQTTVQLVQEVPNEEGLVAIAQGWTRTLSCLMSFKTELLSKFGLEADKDYEGEEVLAHEMFGDEVNIQINESTTPFYNGQDPKINPESKEILCLGDSPIYRITELVEGEANHTTIQYDSVKEPVMKEVGRV